MSYNFLVFINTYYRHALPNHPILKTWFCSANICSYVFIKGLTKFLLLVFNVFEAVLHIQSRATE